MSVHDLLTSNMYNIQINEIKISNAKTDSFRKFKDNIQSITTLDPPGSTVIFETFTNNFSYLDNTPNNCFTFIDPSNIQINKTGVYQIFCQVTIGNDTPGSYFLVGINTQGTIIAMSESIVVSASTLVPFNNGFHTQNASMVLSSIAHLTSGQIIQVQYICSVNSDLYPGAYIGMKYLSI